MAVSSFLLMLFYSLTITGSSCMSKLYTRSCRPVSANNSIYLFLNALFACVYFAVSVRFSLIFDWQIAKYSIIYALLISSHIIINLLTLRAMTLVLYLVFEGFGSTILPCIAEIIVFKTEITLQIIIAIVLMSLAIFLPVLSAKKIGLNPKVVILGIFVMFFSGSANFFGKFIVANEHVNENAPSLFFFTNAFMLIIPIILVARSIAQSKSIIVEKQYIDNLTPEKRQKKSFYDKFHAVFPGFTILSLLCVVICTFCSNSGSLLNIVLLRRISITLLSISSRAFSLLFSFLASVFLFKEKICPTEVVALSLSLAGSIVIII
ncbi:MAG: hypothetical protein SOZ62_01765 [Eubacteriales bacterium]|nr:hypothetical protein [Eubacteriales bacterium]